MALSISYSKGEKELIRYFIKRGDVPCCLYKYRTIEGVKKLLESHSIYFSSYREFNDPFESSINILTDYTPQQYYDSFIYAGMGPELTEELTTQVSNNGCILSCSSRGNTLYFTKVNRGQLYCYAYKGGTI